MNSQLSYSRNGAVEFLEQMTYPNIYGHRSHILLVIYCFVAPLSIAASQICIASLIIYSLLYCALTWQRQNLSSLLCSNETVKFTVPLTAWFLSCVISSISGIAPSSSYSSAISVIYLLLPFCVLLSFAAVSQNTQEFCHRLLVYFFALVCGQSLAAIHTILETGLGHKFPLNPPGAVTESGQLVFTLIAAFAIQHIVFSRAFSRVFHSSFQQPHRSSSPPLAEQARSPQISRSQTLGFTLLTLSCGIIVSWPEAVWSLFPVPMEPYLYQSLAFSVLIILFSLLIFQALKNRKSVAHWAHFMPAMIGLILAAFIVNLKRGPWSGVICEFMLIGMILSRRLLLWMFVLMITACTLLPPVYTRLANSIDDFAIGGGRKNMWALGLELIQRFPLGLGPDNAKYMREFDPTLPELHRHMHNNVLNLAVETGWLGLSLFIWWITATVLIALRCWKKLRQAQDTKPLAELALLLGFALMGWQIAGIVEYNFGDGEVRLIALFFMGIIISIANYQHNLRNGD